MGFKTKMESESESRIKTEDKSSEDRVKEEVKRLKEKDVRFIRPVFVDILGRMLDFTVPSNEYGPLIADGKGFDGSSVEGFARIEESDLKFISEPDTLRVLPWNYKGVEQSWKEAIILGNIVRADGEGYEGDTRALLKSTIEKHKDIGILKCGAELEFFLFDNDKSPVHTDKGGYFRSGSHGEVRKEVQIALNEMGVKVEFDHHEVANSQHEIDLTYNDGLKMADSIIMTKYAIKKIAKMSELYATFMPKPIATINGNGMHIHLSLWKDNKNLFFDEKKKGLSDIAKSYIAGLIKYGREIQVGLNQGINSYKRLAPGYEAPTYLVWGTKNRSAYIRVPEYEKGKESATRIEIRSPDPICNPYLALSLLHTAGMQGVKEGLKPAKPVESDIFHLSEQEKKELNMGELSPSLERALEIFKESSLMKKNLPPLIFQNFIKNKKIEIGNFNRAVTDYEIENYF